MAETQRIAIITGGSRGMGRDTVMRLAERGISSIITYNIRQDEADSTGTQVGGAVLAPADQAD